MVTTIHSIAKLFSLSTATSRYQGKYIGFVGDRLATCEPGPVLLQVTKIWAWDKKSVRSNGDELIQAYTDGLEQGLLWVQQQMVPRSRCMSHAFCACHRCLSNSSVTKGRPSCPMRYGCVTARGETIASVIVKRVKQV